MGAWYLYMLRCKDATIYTGITNDLDRRMEQHRIGKAAKYTRNRRPALLVHSERCNDKSDALRKEAAIKRMQKKKKEQYIRNHETK